MKLEQWPVMCILHSAFRRQLRFDRLTDVEFNLTAVNGRERHRQLEMKVHSSSERERDTERRREKERERGKDRTTLLLRVDGRGS